MKKCGILGIVAIGFVSAVSAQSPVLWWEPPVPGASAFGAALGDVDGDGTIDAAWVHLLSPGTILLNDGAGNFAPHPTAAPLPNAQAVAMGDLNGNGHSDLLIGVHLGSCQVWTNNGAGEFFSTGQAVGPSVGRRSVALADVNGNGHLDAILPSDNVTRASELWTNDDRAPSPSHKPWAPTGIVTWPSATSPATVPPTWSSP